MKDEIADLIQTIIVGINDHSIISNGQDYWQMVEDWRNEKS